MTIRERKAEIDREAEILRRVAFAWAVSTIAEKEQHAAQLGRVLDLIEAVEYHHDAEAVLDEMRKAGDLDAARGAVSKNKGEG